MTEAKIITTKSKRNPQERIFTVNESYAGTKKLSDIFADLLYSAYQKQESEIKGDKSNHEGCLPDKTIQAKYGDSA